MEEPPHTQNRYEHTNGNHVLTEQSHGYFEPQAIAISPENYHEIQVVEPDSALHSMALPCMDESGLVQDHHGHSNEDHVREEPVSSHDEFQMNVTLLPGPQETADIEQDSVLHSKSLHHVDEPAPVQDTHDHKNEGHLVEEPCDSRFEPRVNAVPPSGLHEMQGVEQDSTLHSITDSTTGDMENPRETEAAPEPVPEELAGIGEHSTIEHSNFPPGVLDDDLTTDMQEPPCTP
jgi:hypothetical protein